MDESTQIFLKVCEQNRLSIESLVMGLPESVRLLNTNYGESINPQAYLHALPTFCSLLKLLIYSPRTYDEVCKRYASGGSPLSVNMEKTKESLMCFAIAKIYSRTANLTQSCPFAQMYTRIACLAMLGDHAIEQVDWIIRAKNATHSDDPNSWLAPSMLFTVWTTNLESPGRARQIYPLLDQLNKFTEETLNYALKGQLYMQFPW